MKSIEFKAKDNGGIRVYDAEGDFRNNTKVVRIVKRSARQWEVLRQRYGDLTFDSWGFSPSLADAKEDAALDFAN